MKLSIAPLLALCLFVATPVMFTGCATKETVTPYSEVFVVNAEQAQQMAFEAVDSFLLFERTNRDTLWKMDPGIKGAADVLRVEFPAANASLLAALDSYKLNRSGENRANINTWLAVVSQLKAEAQKWAARLSQ